MVYIAKMAAFGSGDGKKLTANKSNKTQEQIVAGFQELRNQQRATVAKISELEMERKEHELVMSL